MALALFALALALTALLIIGQAAARTLLTATQDNGTLAALGMTRRQLFTASMTETAAATVAGALGAVVIAIAVSPLTPIGPARLAEPDPGISVNAGVLAAGAAAIVVLLAARVAVTAWRQAGARLAATSRNRRRGAVRGSPSGCRGPACRSPPPPACGSRSTRAPAAPASRCAAPCSASRSRWPRWPARPRSARTCCAWSARRACTARPGTSRMSGQFDVITPKQFSQLTAHVPGITDVTFGVHGTVTIGKTVIPAIGLAPGTGPMMSSTVLAGRPPAMAGEIALGASVLRDLGLRVGQTVPVSTPAGKRTMLITGSAVFPYFGQGGFTPTDAGEGAETTAAVLQPLANAANGVGYNFALVSFAPRAG